MPAIAPLLDSSNDGRAINMEGMRNPPVGILSLTVPCRPEKWYRYGTKSPTIHNNELQIDLDLPPFLTQPVKTQNPFKGELSHGVVEKDIHQGV